MNTEISNEEKIQILESLIKRMIFTKYEAELELAAEESLDTPSLAWIEVANKQINDLSVKIQYLEGIKSGI